MIPMMHLGSTILSAVIGRSARAAAAHLMLGQQPHRAMASSSAALQIKALREKSGAPISDVKVVGNCLHALAPTCVQSFDCGHARRPVSMRV